MRSGRNGRSPQRRPLVRRSAQVCTITTEHGDPFCARILDGLGDEVFDVALAAAGHADLRRCSTGVLTDEDVTDRDAGALGAVGGGGDLVADSEPLTGGSGDVVGDFTEGLAQLVGGVVDLGDLLAGVGDNEIAVRRTHSQLLAAFDVVGVEDDLTTRQELIEHCARLLTRPHLQRELGVGGVGEAADLVEFGDSVGCVTDGKVEDAAPSDGEELVAVTDQHHLGVHLVRQLQQRPGSVLVEHSCLVDDEEVTMSEMGAGQRSRMNASPESVFVPTEAVLVQQPCDGVRGGTGRQLSWTVKSKASSRSEVSVNGSR